MGEENEGVSIVEADPPHLVADINIGVNLLVLADKRGSRLTQLLEPLGQPPIDIEEGEGVVPKVNRRRDLQNLHSWVRIPPAPPVFPLRGGQQACQYNLDKYPCKEQNPTHRGGPFRANQLKWLS